MQALFSSPPAAFNVSALAFSAGMRRQSSSFRNPTSSRNLSAPFMLATRVWKAALLSLIFLNFSSLGSCVHGRGQRSIYQQLHLHEQLVAGGEQLCLVFTSGSKTHQRMQTSTV